MQNVVGVADLSTSGLLLETSPEFEFNFTSTTDHLRSLPLCLSL